MTTETAIQLLPSAGEKVLLLNPPVYDTRFHWFQWMQPLTLLQLATYARTVGADAKLLDALEPNRGSALHKERVKVLQLDEDVVNKWRFGQTNAALTRKLRELKKAAWQPDRVYLDCFTTFWWEGAAEVSILAHEVFPQAKILLIGAYGALAEDHARAHLSVDAIVPMVSSEVSTLSSDFSLCTRTPRFAYISLGGDGRTAEDIVNEITEKLTQRKVQHFAFVEYGIAAGCAELFGKVLEMLAQRDLKAVFYALGNIVPGDLVRHPDLPVQMKRAGFQQIVFADDRHLPLDSISDQGLIEDYLQAAELCGKAGFPRRTGSLIGSICIGRAGEDLEARAQLATVVAHHVGSIILWAYQPRLDECAGISLEDQNGKIFPLRGRNNRTYRDYVNLLGLAAILNAKYRQQTFDFLGGGLIPRLLRDSFGRRGWDPDPAVKGSLVLPVRPTDLRQ